MRKDQAGNDIGRRTEQPLRFPGQELAMTWEGAEENYNIFRWYRTGWGRYTQADPIGITSDANVFRYVANRPLVFFDPLGLKKVCCTEGADKLWKDAEKAYKDSQDIMTKGYKEVAAGGAVVASTLCGGAPGYGVPETIFYP